MGGEGIWGLIRAHPWESFSYTFTGATFLIFFVLLSKAWIDEKREEALKGQ